MTQQEVEAVVLQFFGTKFLYSLLALAAFQYNPQGRWGTLKLLRQDVDNDEEVALPTVATKFLHYSCFVSV